jgi:hypothetical protein
MEISPTVKRYGLYAVGGIVGLVIILKLRGGGTAAPVDNTAAYLAAQTAASSQYAQTALQAQAQQAAIDAQTDATNKAYDLQMANLQVTNAANNNAAQAAYVTAQAQMAGAIGSAAGSVIDALNQPAITAINNATIENANAIQSAVSTANTGFLAQATAIKSLAGVSANLASTVGTQLAGQTQAQIAAGQAATSQNNSNNASNNAMLQTAATVAMFALL